MINGSKVNRLNDEKFMLYRIPFGASTTNNRQTYHNSKREKSAIIYFTSQLNGVHKRRYTDDVCERKQKLITKF